MNPTPEQLTQWKEAGVLVEKSIEDVWHGPFTVRSLEYCWERNLEVAARGDIRPYRAPGHIQPHDGSAGRPEHVAGESIVIACWGKAGWDKWQSAASVDWDCTTYYIVLPEIKP